MAVSHPIVSHPIMSALSYTFYGLLAFTCTSTVCTRIHKEYCYQPGITMGMLNNLYLVSLVHPGKLLKMCGYSLCILVHTVLVHVKANDP